MPPALIGEAQRSLGDIRPDCDIQKCQLVKQQEGMTAEAGYVITEALRRGLNGREEGRSVLGLQKHIPVASTCFVVFLCWVNQ